MPQLPRDLALVAAPLRKEGVMLKPVLDAVPDKLPNLALGAQVAGLREPDEIDTDDIPEMPVRGICCGNEDVHF